METLQSMVQLMLLINYLHERTQECKGEQLLAVVTQTRSSKIVWLGKRMIGRGLMELGQRLSVMGKHLLAEAQ
jgi:hypothetical protein